MCFSLCYESSQLYDTGAAAAPHLGFRDAADAQQGSDAQASCQSHMDVVRSGFCPSICLRFNPNLSRK